jgi:monovalent cation/proton antiporter MnhG/PhaG subunit
VSAIIDSVLAFLVIIGSLLLFAASLGLARGRDVIARIQSVTKAGAVGVVVLLLGAAIAAGNLTIFMRDLTASALILVGAAIASQILAETVDHSQH